MAKTKAKKSNMAATKGISKSDNPKKLWCFTCNNPAISATELLETLRDLCTYIVIGNEVGETGTPHFQGYLELKVKKRFNTLKNAFPSTAVPHLEAKIANSTRFQAAEYCRKEGNFVEHGTAPKAAKSHNGSSKNLELVLSRVGNGEKISKVASEHPATWARNYRAIDVYQSMQMEIPNWRDMEVHLYYGKTGTGKTFSCFDKYPDLFKKPIGKGLWFDGYEFEKTVLIDEFTGQYPLSDMLQIMDHYPVQVEKKGSHVKLACNLVLLTTNRHPSKYYVNEKSGIPWEHREEEKLAFFRRITKVFWYKARDEIQIFETPDEVQAFLLEEPNYAHSNPFPASQSIVPSTDNPDDQYWQDF